MNDQSETVTHRTPRDLEPDCPQCEFGRLVYNGGLAGWICSLVECGHTVFRPSKIRSLHTETE